MAVGDEVGGEKMVDFVSGLLSPYVIKGEYKGTGESGRVYTFVTINCNIVPLSYQMICSDENFPGETEAGAHKRKSGDTQNGAGTEAEDTENGAEKRPETHKTERKQKDAQTERSPGPETHKKKKRRQKDTQTERSRGKETHKTERSQGAEAHRRSGDGRRTFPPLPFSSLVKQVHHSAPLPSPPRYSPRYSPRSSVKFAPLHIFSTSTSLPLPLSSPRPAHHLLRLAWGALGKVSPAGLSQRGPFKKRSSHCWNGLSVSRRK